MPVFCGSAFKNKGVQTLLDGVVDFLPSPVDVADIQGHEPHHDETHVTRKTSDDEPFAALAFKITTDPFVGRLTYIRVYSGVLAAGSYVYNSVKDRKERVGRLVQMHANKRAGDRGGPRRRHRGGDRAQGHADRRHAVRRGPRRSSSRR